ncbi:uncharacterized protein LACBIDRAFT_309998 [Laccaria bicolor S238N-H82]|uniref:Predicted protein n=1 Tax=Laccaria bicolor (strain S238N-H82 / ATCC MYA-4686) TaxID=486041 RepID=B0DTF5_LACBS|nr:uncharacterized protein LACBIDRAFT_309998 [Laccaria bicolor S238N-H82]EDR02103.1 predicted protein [Laccaria bicolor S238N-H82]|eukprot:XP_001887260.1 predicted protein [Laccaria bicolor S238N-H82]
MVAASPFFRGTWTLKRFNATIINDVWPEVAFFSLVASMVCLVSKKTEHHLGINNQLLTVLGTVLGLVISFRTSSAYERYQDGRKMWTNIATASRTLAQLVWLHVPNDRENKGLQQKQTVVQSIIEKKSMINLIQAFSVSAKHFLRGEQGIYYEDLYPLICFLPRYSHMAAEGHPYTPEKLPLWQLDGEQPCNGEEKQKENHTKQFSSTDEKNTDTASDQGWFSRNRGGKHRKFDPESVLPYVHCERTLKPAHMPPPMTVYDYIPLLRFFKWVVHTILRKAHPGMQRRRKKNPFSEIVESSVPLEISLILQGSGLLQPASATGFMTNLNTLQDALSNLERICNTPLPFAYQIHLRMSLWLYLFLLPFQVYNAFGYLTIPGTAFASFLYLGFLEIGQEIENPFNYDLNDLDLDNFCLSIQRELHEITAHPNPEPRDFVFNATNQPFAPADRRSAADLVSGNTEYDVSNAVGPVGIHGLRKTLVKSWMDVDTKTRP